MSATAKRICGYVLLALACYAIGFSGVAPAAMLFIAGGLVFEGFLWFEARRLWRRRTD